MTTERVSLYLIHPHRSKEAFFTLIEDWQGILVSDGYGVYQDWVNQRQTCLAHLIRSARGWSEKRQLDLAACGAGHSRSCSACVIWPRRRLRGASGGPGMRVCAP